ncbi:SURF1 family protein [Sulfitobacter aestuariivivens]|uniref:SURF1-like protein n=1 Tax=Sulfitobacter aestuariivivens TaxID=2766981 RepID=A0A927HG23_9RHOB|nr:SURF1 family protein [Sulfitobacter aestuariivivens]MBD3663820.1 SURF1 family protein [Sulfitobacter aestuariivivens]
MRTAPFLIIVGLGGAAILIALGVWQVQRLAWKEGVIADIDARLKAQAVELPADPVADKHAFLPVTVTGIWRDTYVRVLVSQKVEGAGYRIISALETDTGPILLDHGFVPTGAQLPAAPSNPSDGTVTVTGNLQWPDETDSFTPTPDLDNNIWFARDVAAMADQLDTRPILLVAREMSESAIGATPLPVDTSRIPNNHLQYAITWFSLAALWLAMSFYFLRRRAHPSES